MVDHSESCRERGSNSHRYGSLVYSFVAWNLGGIPFLVLALTVFSLHHSTAIPEKTARARRRIVGTEKPWKQRVRSSVYCVSIANVTLQGCGFEHRRAGCMNTPHALHLLLPLLLLLLLQTYLADQVVPLFGNTHTTTSITGAQTTCFRHEARQIIAQAVNAKVGGGVVSSAVPCVLYMRVSVCARVSMGVCLRVALYVDLI